MNNQEIIQKIIHYIQLAQDEKITQAEIYADNRPDSSLHEFLFFVKPEITLKNDAINREAIFEMLFEKLTDYDLKIKNIRLLAAPYLAEFDIIAQHYGVINAMSRNPLTYFSNEAVENFKSGFGKAPDDVLLLGSLEFLKQFPIYTPHTLNQLWQGSKAVKLAGGTYCAKLQIQSKDVYLINGFHPLQLIHFTEKGRSIIVFKLSGNVDWSAARNRFIGKTNPADALPGSLRNELLNRQELFGLQDVSASQNGFHLSAGPVEGLVELIRYGSDYTTLHEKTPDNFIFGRQLRVVFTEEKVKQICSNPLVTFKGQKTSTFDLTEEKNSETALQLLKDSIF